MSETEVIAGIKKVLGKLSEEKNKKRFHNWNKSIGFTFKDLGKTWTTTLNSGVPSDIIEKKFDKSAEFDIHLITTPKIWLGILNKEIDAIKAFTSGELKIKAKTTDLLKLRKVLA